MANGSAEGTRRLELVRLLLLELLAVAVVALKAVGGVLSDVLDEVLHLAAAVVRHRRLRRLRHPEEGRVAKDQLSD